MKRYAVSSVLVIAAMASALRAETLEECAAIADDAQRVSCYDRVAGRDPSKPVSADAAACEAALVQRLVAPATYKRIDISETRIPMSLDEYVDKKLLEIRDRHLETPDLATPERAALREEEARIEQAGIQPFYTRITITFDAQNRMGGYIRQTEVCTPPNLPG